MLANQKKIPTVNFKIVKVRELTFTQYLAKAKHCTGVSTLKTDWHVQIPAWPPSGKSEAGAKPGTEISRTPEPGVISEFYAVHGTVFNFL